MNYQSPYTPYPYPWMGVTPSPQYAPPQTSTFQTMSQSQHLVGRRPSAPCSTQV